MSDVNWRLLMRRRDHTFQPPVPETTAAFGVPNACTTCHDDKTPEWAARQMDAWWGDGERRAEEHARWPRRCTRPAPATPRRLPGAGRHRRRSHPGRGAARQRARVHRRSWPARALLDGGAGARARPPRRGSAPAAPAPVRDAPLEPRVLGALLGAASDPEPMVRAAAVRALGVARAARRARAGGAHGAPGRRRARRAGARRRGAARPGRRDRAGPRRRGADPRAGRSGRQPALVPRLGAAAGVAGVAAGAARRGRRGRTGGARRDCARRRSSPVPTSSAACWRPGPAATTRRWPAGARPGTSIPRRRTSTG